MLVLSSSSPPLLEVFKDRVSSSAYSSSSSSSFTLVLRRSSFRRPLLCCCASNLKLMPDSASPSIAQVVGSGEAKHEDDVKDSKIAPLHSGTFLNVRCGEELLAGIKRESELGTLPVNIASAMEELYQNYRNAVFSSGIPHADEIVLSNMSAMLDLVLLDVEDPFEFSPHHKAVREPFDYYMFGQNYVRPLIDFW
ncbi:hypothetical protein Cgig2_015561 [Carnegiea gigantea]|uniref:glycerol-3-phosphate 1-O-acyltransferase n=1 Tax=Carnegiea gigantea TaxID=171969 RepID=A0A9Q1K0U6_9CARY|nr:hypothetical protein Cgig2_015561 [Carnegiea gigantea]